MAEPWNFPVPSFEEMALTWNFLVLSIKEFFFDEGLRKNARGLIRKIFAALDMW